MEQCTCRRFESVKSQDELCKSYIVHAQRGMTRGEKFMLMDFFNSVCMDVLINKIRDMIICTCTVLIRLHVFAFFNLMKGSQSKNNLEEQCFSACRRLRLE